MSWAAAAPIVGFMLGASAILLAATWFMHQDTKLSERASQLRSWRRERRDLMETLEELRAEVRDEVRDAKRQVGTRDTELRSDIKFAKLNFGFLERRYKKLERRLLKASNDLRRVVELVARANVLAEDSGSREFFGRDAQPETPKHAGAGDVRTTEGGMSRPHHSRQTSSHL